VGGGKHASPITRAAHAPSGAHRIAVWTRIASDVDQPGWSADPEIDRPGKDAILVNVFSQSDAINFIYRHCVAPPADGEAAGDADATDSSSLRELACLSLAELGLGGGGEGTVVCVRAEEPLLVAFRTMTLTGVTAVVLVDELGVLVGCLTASDVRCMLPQHAAALLTQACAEYLESLHRMRYFAYGSRSGLGAAATVPHRQSACAAAHMRLVAVTHASGCGGEGARPVGVLPREERFGCTAAVRPGARLIDVLSLMAEGLWGGYHTVFVIDGAGKPVGVVATSDVLRLLVA
jgi:hypothetical protein